MKHQWSIMVNGLNTEYLSTEEMVKKVISDTLNSAPLGQLIYKVFKSKVPNLRYRGYSFTVPVEASSFRIVSMIFWGFYEAAETRLIRKYLRPDVPVIEIGSSIGVVSSIAISRLQNDAFFVGVEANYKIFGAIRSNIDRHNQNGCPYKLLNKAISYQQAEMFLHTSTDSTESYLVQNRTHAETDLKVDKVRLIDVVNDFELKEFTLISDIEGSEIEFILNDKKALCRCTAMIIELHSTNYEGRSYSVADLVKLISDQGFVLIERDGLVFYFERRHSS